MFHKKVKKFVSLCMIVVLIVLLLPSFSLEKLIAGELNQQIYNKDSVVIEFKVSSKWESGFEGQFIIHNNSTTSLENWRFQVRCDFEFTSIWDGEIESEQGGMYTFKYPSWNPNIAANKKAVIGFIGKSTQGVKPPYDCTLSQMESDTLKGDYTVTYRTTSDWKDAFNGEISITNNKTVALEAWQLEFDFDRTLKQYWNTKLVDHTGEHYVVKHDGWNSVIEPGKTVTFGFEGMKGNVTTEPKNIILKAMDKNQSTEEIEDEGTKDTDDDGLPDWYEEQILETDKNKQDTDGDGLSDYFEVFVYGTDPNKKDTDGNGITDDKEDPDKDGLTNLEEFQYKTDPNGADTDEDGLTDGEEVFQYKTNPLKIDTDGDGIDDMSEIAIQLDPNNPSTHPGLKDSEYYVWQTLDNTRYLEFINTNSPYELSIKAYARGNLQNMPINTNYADIMFENRAIIGRPIDFDDRTMIDKGELNFKLKNDFLKEQTPLYPEQELGIKRYAIFKIDEKSHTLYPMPTEYKVKKNLVTASFEGSGAYCLVDLECLVYDLALVERENTATYNENKIENPITPITKNELRNIINSDSKNAESKQERNSAKEQKNVQRQVDLVLAIDSTGSMNSYINTVKENIVYLINDLRKENISLYISIIDYKDIVFDGNDSTKINHPKKVDFLNNPEDIITVLNNINAGGGGKDGPETPIDALGAAENLKFRKNADKYIFLLTNAGYKNDNNYGIRDLSEIAQLFKKSKITTSVITEFNHKEKYDVLCDTTGGKWINILDQFQNDIYQMIMNGKSKEPYYAIASVNLSVLELESTPEKTGKTDTDQDGLPDSKEINWEKIKVKNGELQLPQLKDFISGYKKSDYKNIAFIDPIMAITVLPINSSPTSEDSDYDYYKDSVDKNPFKMDPMRIEDTMLDDSDAVTESKKSSKKLKSIVIPDGELIYDDPVIRKKPSFVYQREQATYQDGYFLFELTPQKDSDYIFTAASQKEAEKKAKIHVWHEEGILFWKKTVDDVANKVEMNSKIGKTKYYFSLKKDEKYTIALKYDSPQKINFKAEQDNWVKASEGGVWECTKYSDFAVNTNFMISGIMYAPTLEILESIKYKSEAIEILALDEENLESSIEVILTNLKIDYTKADILNALASIAGSVCMMIVIKKAGIQFKAEWSLVAAEVAGDSLTLYGAGSGVETLFNVMESYGIERALRDGDLNIKCAHQIDIIKRIWDPWETPGFINKYYLGSKGSVKVGLTPEQIIKWCKW